jgi:hypothetical protein
MQIVADIPALSALPVGPLPDKCMCIVQTPTRRYWLNKGGATDGTDEHVAASGGGVWDFVEAA